MLESLRIKNFRVLEEFNTERLARINLFAGCNNSGKTTLLEALFLMFGFGNPHTVFNSSITRGENSPEIVSPDVIRDVFWKPLFSTLDMERDIEITGRHSQHGFLRLRISGERQPGVTELSLKHPDKITSLSTPFNDLTLTVSFEKNSRVNTKQVRLMNQRIHVDPPDMEPPLPAVFLSSRNIVPGEEPMRLGQLRKRKQGDIVLDSLRTIEPRLKSVEDNSASGRPMIFGDIGLSELVPLQIMGEGITRVARLVLAISAAENGIVLVDEVETGLHYSVLSKVWKAIDKASRKFNTQVFATTHSFECVEASCGVLDPGDFLFHRLEASDTGGRCVTYESGEINAAIRHDFEVR